MSRRHYQLPPLTTLTAFEAAARHLSFKKAAQELSVTPGAVSHQIKALEGELGQPLFLRRHRGVELTPDGEALADALASAFGRVSQVVQGIRDRRIGGRVTIGSSTAVAALWLSGSIIRYWRHTPGQDVNQVAQDALFGDRADVDLYIRYGPEHRAGVTQTPLYRDRLVPVASPDLAQGLVGSDLATLAQQRLIFLESQDRSWTTWADWFRALGYDGPIRDGVRVNRYSVALQMAQDGAGLALGWQRLIRPMLETGQLVPVGDHHLMAPHQFYLVGRSNMSDGAQALRSWILDELRSGSV